jgi:hypothetical protein
MWDAAAWDVKETLMARTPLHGRPVYYQNVIQAIRDGADAVEVERMISDPRAHLTDEQMRALRVELRRRDGGVTEARRGEASRRHRSREGDDVSDQQIIALKREAAMAGDREMAAICDRALGGSARARRRCIEVIRSAQAQGDNAPSKRNLDEMFNAYVETALWSSTADDDTPLDRLDAEVADSALDKMRKDVESFARENAELIAGEWSQAGHDFWLTRNGHGAGFWETPDWPEREGKLLTDAAHAYGEVYLYVGDDGMIYSD